MEVEFSETRLRLLQMGFARRVVDVALRHFRATTTTNSSTEEIVSFLLEHETAIKLQLEHDSRASQQGPGGLENVFRREKNRLDEFVSLVEDGLFSVDALSVLADEIEFFTRSLVERKRLNGQTEDDIMDDMLHRSMMATGSEGEGPAGSTAGTMVAEIGRVLEPCARASYGVLSLSEAYRIYNRSRVAAFTDIATPEEFVRACRKFEATDVPMCLERGAVFLSEGIETFVKRVVDVVSNAAAGASRVDVGSKMGMPVGVAGLYLHVAEERGRIVRDDTPRGVYYHANRFHEFFR